jgi:phosphoglycerate kinase
MQKLALDDLDLKGKRVLVRVDFNVPLADAGNGTQEVTDDTRIRAALPTIRRITESGGKAILMSHLGRPKDGQPDPKYSLAPVAKYFQNLLGTNVIFSHQATGEEVRRRIDAAPAGSVILLENTRFLPGETKNNEELAAELAKLGDVYVNDAFGSAHRAHASTEGIARKLPAAMGYLLQREVEYLSRLLETPEHPFVGILGGAKVSDKIAVIESLLERCDQLLIGGAMSYTFLKALGNRVGSSRVEEDKLDIAKVLYDRAGGKIKLPTDHVVAKEFNNDAPHRVVERDIPDGEMGLDIGPETVRTYRETLLHAKTIVWNGPMGVFEMSSFAKGTFAMAETLAEATDRGALTVVGGGDSVAAITQAGYEDRVSHVSTGGGAMLEFLEGQILPGVAALKDAPHPES